MKRTKRRRTGFENSGERETPKRPAKPAQVKTVEIFEGMTVVELAKCTGSSVRPIQEILTSVGEKVGSEFDPITIDVAELVSTSIR
ncbi:hypothetical protein FCM35_KLT19649 [Carex littledalei]|uniref:Uncharacterized protein n=1 Tax=Carex littledalei TaxID=544730 RepID=A0A833VDF7_9POAL|nr:hypothetical protein FCM35_KLT19649 [Carex littledalei]